MIVDALLSTNSHFRFVENLTIPEEYMKYTDDLIKHIEATRKDEFKEAQKILKRLHSRDLYKCVGEILFDHLNMKRLLEVRVEDIVNC